MTKKRLKHVKEAIERFETQYYIDAKIEASVEVENIELDDDEYHYDATVHYDMEGRSETYTDCFVTVKEIEELIK